MRAITAVQTLSGSCCFCAAVATAALAEATDAAMAAAADVRASGSSYCFCAAVVTTTASDASNRASKIERGHFPARIKKAGLISCLFDYVFTLFFICLSRFSAVCMSLPSGVFPVLFLRCRHASSNSYTRLPSMINRPMDFLLNKNGFSIISYAYFDTFLIV